MERLPDLLVLDFCEWLQQSILRMKKGELYGKIAGFTCFGFL